MKLSTVPKSKFSDLQLLGRLKGLAWLSAEQLKNLDGSMTSRNVKHKGVIFEEHGALARDTHILLTGTAELCHMNGSRTQVVAILSPGVLFRMPLMARGFDHNFQWTALNDCRVSELLTDTFIQIGMGSVAAKFPANFRRLADIENERRGYMMGRYPSFLGLTLLQRVAVALLELALEFGVQNTRGVLIRITLVQRQLADLVGASRAFFSRVSLPTTRAQSDTSPASTFFWLYLEIGLLAAGFHGEFPEPNSQRNSELSTEHSTRSIPPEDVPGKVHRRRQA